MKGEVYTVKSGRVNRRLRVRIDGKVYWAGKYFWAGLVISSISSTGRVEFSEEMRNGGGIFMVREFPVRKEPA